MEGVACFRGRSCTGCVCGIARLFCLLCDASCRRSKLCRGLQWVPLGVLVGTRLVVALRASGRVDQSFIRVEEADVYVAIGQYFFGYDSVAESMDPSMAVPRYNVALSRTTRGKAIAEVIHPYDVQVDYFLASGLGVPFFLSCFGFMPFLSFF